MTEKGSTETVGVVALYVTAYNRVPKDEEL